MHNLYVNYRVYSIHINYAYTMYNYGVIFQTSWFLHFEIVCHTSFNYYYYRPNAPFEVFDICLSKWICRGICFTDIYLPFRWMWSDFSITRMPWYEINPDWCVKFWNEFTSNKKKCMVFLKDYHLLEFHFLWISKYSVYKKNPRCWSLKMFCDNWDPLDCIRGVSLFWSACLKPPLPGQCFCQYF